MSRASKMHRELTASIIKDKVPSYAAHHVEPAFRGDVEAAGFLAITLDNQYRGNMAVAMWQVKVPRDAFRVFLASVWGHDHGWLIDAAGTRQRLSHLFRYAAFPIPESLPEIVTVWRGTTRDTLAAKRPAYSWSTNRDVACWFAMRTERGGAVPVVLRAQVPRSEIALFSTDRSEDEAVLLKWPAGAAVDGTPEDWRAGYERYERSIRPVETAAASAGDG